LSWLDGWEAQIAAGPEGIAAILQAKRPMLGSAMLRPFFEAYEIVADVLRDASPEISEPDLTKLALGVGRQHVAQARVRSNASVSALLFATARQVVADQQLLQRAPDLSERRAAFRAEMRGILADLDTVESVARDRFYTREVASRRSTGA
jgi:glycerol-3-phosphate O-acyltransferase